MSSTVATERMTASASSTISSSSTTTTTATTTIEEALSKEEMIEMLKNLASLNEKLHKWEQSMKKLDSYPDSDTNKVIMNDIIDFIKQDKSTPHEKAIYLYGQLAQKCKEQENYLGAAKAYERAATLRFDRPTVIDEVTANNAKITIQYLEKAIAHHDMVHKYKHAGTLHYRISRILRLINGPPEQVTEHYNLALEYFTRRNNEEKRRLILEGQKISCFSRDYSDYSSRVFKDSKRKYDSFNQPRYRDDYSPLNKYHRYPEVCESDHSSNNYDYYPMESTSKSYAYGAGVSPKDAHHTPAAKFIGTAAQMQKHNRRIEDRIESAKKLVKKLHKFCPYYEVKIDGEDAGRVFCRVCERHLGAVSSTLKNHVNTQEHKQALEESVPYSSIASVGNSAQKLHTPSSVGLGMNDKGSPTGQLIGVHSGGMSANHSHMNHHMQQHMAANCSTAANNGIDFGDIDIQWMPNYQSPVGTVDYGIGGVNPQVKPMTAL